MAHNPEEEYFEDEADQASLQEASQKEKLLQCRLYKLLLEKYTDLIDEKEKRTIGEIKALVNAEDLTIQSILADFKKPDYSFPKDYLPAAENVLKFIQKEINYVEPEINLNYWLSAKEIFSNKVGDDEDLAVFLCSMLFALGDENASVIIAELENLQTHAFAITDFQGKFFLWDPSQSHDFYAFYGKREEALRKYGFNGAKIKRFLYKFNHSNYEQFM